MTFPEQKHADLRKFVDGYNSEIVKGYKSINIQEIERIFELLDTTIKQKNTIFTSSFHLKVIQVTTVSKVKHFNLY